LIDFVIEGASHIDLLYGKAARELISPLYEQIIERVWENWSYLQNPFKPCDSNLSELPVNNLPASLNENLFRPDDTIDSLSESTSDHLDCYSKKALSNKESLFKPC